MELDTIADLRAGTACCEAHKDYVCRDVFSDILIAEEEHVDWLETRLDLIDQMGPQNYLLSANQAQNLAERPLLQLVRHWPDLHSMVATRVY